LSKEWLVEGVACRRSGLSLQFDGDDIRLGRNHLPRYQPQILVLKKGSVHE
jgi:hypothetical protein